MATLDPHVALALASITGVGFLMLFSGMHKRGLEWRRRRRICPSCGREIVSGTCGCAG